LVVPPGTRRRILLLGKNGQVGWELQRALLPLGAVIALDRRQLDLSDPDRVRAVLRETEPDLIVNAAAYTAVDRAEEEPELAMAVNGVAPGILAEEAERQHAALIHYSTAHVFDGEGTVPYTEKHEPNPPNAYGKTKLAGERAIQNTGVPHLILRTGWVYGMRGKNFLLTILRLARERKELKVVDDQIGTPTWCRAIAEATAQILAQSKGDFADLLGEHGGLYHLTAGGETSWYGFARAIVELDPNRAEQILEGLKPIPTSEYPTPARRPAYLTLENEELNRRFGLKLPDWRTQLELALSR
jgi:dTDP-4-dehydrorhamnose reductase